MNKVKLLFIFLINRPFYMKFLLVVMFVIYGAIISTISYSISNYYQVQNTKEKLIKTQKQSFKLKTNYLNNKMDNFIYVLESIKSNRVFNKYLFDKSKKRDLEDIFLLLMNSKKEISQLRFIDINGNEKIRFDRDDIDLKPHKVVECELQNKSSRYYFKKIKELKDNSVWYSKLDLNIEHGVIQKPIVPTLRIGTPIYKNGVFEGVLIMNIFFKDIIDNFVDSTFFYITIFDKDGEFIYNRMDIKNELVDNSWSRYLKNSESFEKYYHYKRALLKDKEVKEYVFSQSIMEIIPNEDRLSIQFIPKVLKLKEVHEHDKNYIFSVTITVLLISIPLALLISYIPNLINNELYKTKKLLEAEAGVVDEYVYLTVANKYGVIQDVSQAYLDLTGYTKKELIGKKHNLLKHPDTSSDTYEDLWRTILDKKIWKGELKNLKKDGTEFNVTILIKPMLDEKGEIKNFTAYVQDTTYQKQIEKKSVTDELTGLFNKREFTNVFKKELSLSRKFNNSYSMMILDIDYFKQYNDTYGHLQGDYALAKVAKTLLSCCKRSNDLAFRIGGEEFAVIFNSSSKTDAYNFALQIKKAVEQLKIPHKKSKLHKYLTISIGVYFSKNTFTLSEDEIFQKCDDLLYEAKQRGRNQVVI